MCPPKLYDFHEELRKSQERKRIGPRGNALRSQIKQEKEHHHNVAQSFKRRDLDNRYFRSAWEANYARYLNWCIETNFGGVIKWEYEPKRFKFEKITTGNRFYTPDFKVYFDDGTYEWHEVKGWLNDSSKTKLKRFNRYFPEEAARLVIIDRQKMKIIRNNFAAVIPNWESPDNPYDRTAGNVATGADKAIR